MIKKIKIYLYKYAIWNLKNWQKILNGEIIVIL